MDNSHDTILSEKDLFHIMESLYQELFVLNENKEIMYVNRNSLRNYGLRPDAMIGRSRLDFAGVYFWPEKIPDLYQTKVPSVVEQVTATGRRIQSTSVPVFRDDDTVVKVVCVVEETEDEIDLDLSADSALPNPAPSDPTDHPEPYEPGFQGIVAESMEMKRALYGVELAAKSQFPLLIQGESGTGKTLLAEYFHKLSDRRDAPFFSINCASIPEQLLESELFGYEPYAFTGANHKGKKGLVEQAKGGTLFLDEIGELAPVLQAKLLDLLEDGTFRRVGGTAPITAEVRFVCATNQDLVHMIQNRTFREDLYWRINVLDIYLPPLRNRPADTAVLIQQLLAKFNAEYQAHKSFSKDAEAALLCYTWPGNVRELRNMIERLVVISDHDQITLSDLPDLSGLSSQPIFRGPPSPPQMSGLPEPDIQSLLSPGETLDSALKHMEEDIILQTHLRHPTLKAFTTALQISESTARRLLKRYVK